MRGNSYVGDLQGSVVTVYCDSSWTLSKRFFNPLGYWYWKAQGVLSAGHCQVGAPAIDTIIDHSQSPAGATALTHLMNGDMAWGDLAWYNTDSAALVQPIFYSDIATTRWTESVEPAAGFSIGESICFYSRKQNMSFCDTVAQTVQGCTLTDEAGHTFTFSKLVRLNHSQTVKGDSGGPWYYGTKAYGSHTGICNSGNVMTVADYIDEGLVSGLGVYLHSQYP